MLCGLEWVWLSVDALRVHINQTHLNCSQWVLHRAGVINTAVALIGWRKPFLLATPVDVLLRVPDVCATKAKAKGLQTKRLVGDVSSQNH